MENIPLYVILGALVVLKAIYFFSFPYAGNIIMGTILEMLAGAISTACFNPYLYFHVSEQASSQPDQYETLNTPQDKPESQKRGKKDYLFIVFMFLVLLSGQGFPSGYSGLLATFGIESRLQISRVPGMTQVYQVQCLSAPYDSTVFAQSRYTYTSYYAYVEYPDGILLSTNTTNSVLKLQFRYVEFGHVCSTSYVKVYEGQSSYGRLLKTFCGTTNQDILSTGQYVFVEYTSEQTDRRFQLSCQSIPDPLIASSNTKGIAGGIVAVAVAVFIVVGGVYRYKRGAFWRKLRNRSHRNNTQGAVTPPTTNVTDINTPATYPANPSTHPEMQYNSYPPNAQDQYESHLQHPPPSPYPFQAPSQYQPQNHSQDLYPPHQYAPSQPQTQDLYPPSKPPYTNTSQSPFPQQPTAPPMYVVDDLPPPYPGT
ncbi:uncharacterized protein [Haliotis asinina]|uniref:uncharacterized protein n=1 Tax=Haliotis asinina TaxID=109174 RepID=UPI003531CD3D